MGSVEIGDAVEVLEADESVIGLDGVVDDLLELLARSKPATPCIVGGEGSGRTAALRTFATRLADGERGGPLAGTPVIRLSAEAVVGGRRAEAVLDMVPHGAKGAIIAIDDLEVVLTLASPATDLAVRGAVRALVGRSDLRTVVALDAAFRSRLETEESELYGELAFVELPTPENADLIEMGRRRAWVLSTQQRVGVPADLVELAAGPRQKGDRRDHPGLLFERLDHAATRARLRGVERAEVEDLELDGAAGPARGVEPAELGERLRRRIAGQDEAIDGICARLALTTADLDLRPHRPNGVFLFAGPTGVGKTALAKALAEALYGTVDDHLIRLDMSEYAERWSLSRLFGPQPGYIGSDEPSGWLSTKVLDKPSAVVLLDEVEKAHPNVWNAFLQVFDDGRLTDTRGRTASFDDTVVIMTSNAGARAFTANPIGFGVQSEDDADDDAAADVNTALAKLMPPEFLNRIDETFVFRPLPKEIIAKIARMEIDRTIASLAERGWTLEVEPEVVAHIAEEGFDPAFGARHLQRNIETRLLQGLSGLGRGAHRASLSKGEVVWEAVPEQEGAEGQ